MIINASRSSPERPVGAGGRLNRNCALSKRATRAARASRLWHVAGVQVYRLENIADLRADYLRRAHLVENDGGLSVSCRLTVVFLRATCSDLSIRRWA